MSIATIIVIILIIALLGGFSGIGGGPFYGTGYYGGGGLGLVIVILLIGPLAALLITVSNLGALGAWLPVSARLPFVAGLDRYLPSAFARIHPKRGTPHIALLVQAFCGVVFILLSQAGTSVYGAYEVLVSMGIISYFIPYLFVFAALIRFQREAASPEVIRIPGGKPVAIALGVRNSLCRRQDHLCIWP